MKALLLNGSKTDESVVSTVSNYLEDILKITGNQVDVMVLRKENIKPCLGCFGCWLKTPGKCVIKDSASDLPSKVMRSDVVFLLTPVTFGMYSSELKRALDRFVCPILLPFLVSINGEIHHINRYSKYPKLAAIGVMPGPDAESENTFETLVNRNSINMHTTVTSTIVYSSDASPAIKEKIVTTLSKVGCSNAESN